MVTVELKQVSQDAANLFNHGQRYWFYHPVNRHSAQMIADVNFGSQWFEAAGWDRIKEALENQGEKMTKRWYHRRTKRQAGY